MLELRRLRLVNWHYFADSTISFSPTSLLVGDNATGKSTIIDAIQYALVAQVSRIRFNSAAADRRAARTLESYCRCKIGADGVEYLRGDCLSHVILEFAEGERAFCAGIMVEAFVEGDARESEWVFEDASIADIAVFDGDSFLTPRLFRDRLKQAGGHVCSTKREYNNRLTHLLGVYRRVGDFNPYLAAVVRSVSFSPFTSVNHFVCNYILEEHNVDVSAMKENLENYRLAEQEAVRVQAQIEALEEIAAQSDEVLLTIKQILNQEYLHVRLRFEEAQDKVTGATRGLEETERELSNCNEYYRIENERKERLDAQRQEIRFALASSEEHRLRERLQRDLAENQRAFAFEQERSNRRTKLLAECEEALERPLAQSLDDEQTALEATVREQTRRSVELDVEAQAKREEVGSLTSELEELQSGMLRYPESTTRLQAALKKANIESAVLADLLEVEDESWQSAVEGWLDARRFSVLVDPAEFAKATGQYTRLSAEVSGVGLPNLAALAEATPRPGSLAELVVAATPFAGRYVTFLLGDVVRADAGELVKHREAVSIDCFAHAENAFWRLEQEACERWYIGRSARKRRMERIEARLAELRSELDVIARERSTIEERLDRLATVLGRIPEIRELSNASVRVEHLTNLVSELEEQIAGIDTTAIEELEKQIEVIGLTILDVDRQLAQLNREIGELTERERRIDGDREEWTQERTRRKAAYEGFLSEHADRHEQFQSYFDSRVGPERERGDFSYDDFFRRYESALSGIETHRERARKELLQKKQGYNHRFNALQELQEDSAHEYRQLLTRYRETELPQYRERISHARSEAERQFREHFVARLNEHLLAAEDSFKEINHILRTISFGKDLYHFTLSRKPERRALLAAISSAAEIREDEGTLFEALHSDEERESIEALFSKILTHDSDDPDIRDLCDYRQYFTYDIRIRHQDQIDEKTKKPLESYLSRVLREKSGGETQTPYYVAIAASFFRFYKDSPNAIRLVLFDEAFNKMDDARIGQMISFFRKLSMQVVTAVPTEKLESIAPHVERTTLVLRKNYRAFVREYQKQPDTTEDGE